MAGTRLYFTGSAAEQWRTLAGPWLKERAGRAWKNPKPTVILTPSRAESFYLRSRLVAENVSFLGLRFWTPSDARKFLCHEILPEIGAVNRDELRLLARSCAEKLYREEGAERSTLLSVIREPDPFLRAYDLLLGAGWNPAQDGAVYGRKLAHELQATLRGFQIATQSGLHRQLRREAASRNEGLIADLLVVGFNAAHWPLWDLLKAIVFSAAESVVALSEPRFFGEEIDQLWIGSWEEVTQTEAGSPIGTIFPDDVLTPFAALVDSYEKGESGVTAGEGTDLTFCVTQDLDSSVRAVVLRTLAFLRQENCTRLGIVFPKANALALGVAEELRRQGVPLDDGTGAWEPGIFERRCWQSWISLQEEPGVGRLVAWVRACEAQGIPYGLGGSLSARTIADELEDALGESLVDDLNFIARQLEENVRGKHSGQIADFLRHRVSLPESATFQDFITIVRQAMTLPGWEEYRARLLLEPPAWLLADDKMILRRTFIEWLKEFTNSQIRARSAESNHFYGKVHLLLYAQITGQTWSHLILTGLNEGIWPGSFEAAAFGSRHELTELNRLARVLNCIGKQRGGQGMGHETVGPDRGRCLLPLERRDLVLRDLCDALESTDVAACLTATTTEGGRSLLPSDFFSHAFHARTGQVLDDDTFRGLAGVTHAWCERHQFLFDSASAKTNSEIEGTRIAYVARRDPTQPFGPYEFAFARPPSRPIQLSCKQWEEAWNHPAAVWLQEVVGASPWAEGMLSWPRAVGTWVHRWLAHSLRECRQQNSAKDFLPLLLEAADREALRVRNRARSVGLDLYPWWEEVWGQARSVALCLGEMLASHLPDTNFLIEFRLPEGLKIALPGSDWPHFILKGRIDLLLVTPGDFPYDLTFPNFSGCACWVIDFKTGSAQTLNVRKIEEGKGLQPVLYALAVRALGAASTAITLHTGDTPLQPQVRLDEVSNAAPLFRSLDRLHRGGVFGMRARADSAYGYSPSYPMATRFVLKSILTAKWALVHGSCLATENGGE